MRTLAAFFFHPTALATVLGSDATREGFLLRRDTDHRPALLQAPRVRERRTTVWERESWFSTWRRRVWEMDIYQWIASENTRWGPKSLRSGFPRCWHDLRSRYGRSHVKICLTGFAGMDTGPVKKINTNTWFEGWDADVKMGLWSYPFTFVYEWQLNNTDWNFVKTLFSQRSWSLTHFASTSDPLRDIPSRTCSSLSVYFY